MILVLLIRDMQTRTGVAKLFRESKVNDIHNEIGMGIELWDDEVGRLDVPVDEVARVHVFDTRDLRVGVGERMIRRGNPTRERRQEEARRGACWGRSEHAP